MALQDALEFLTRGLEEVSPSVYAYKYPEVVYPTIVPIETSSDAWASALSFTATDSVGRAGFIHSGAGDAPTVALVREKVLLPIHDGGTSFGYTETELQREMQLGGSLSSGLAIEAKKAYERHVEGFVLTGNAGLGAEGLLNAATITKADAPTGSLSGADTTWKTKSPEEIVGEINNLLESVASDTEQTENANTLLLPPSAFAILVGGAGPISPGSTLLDFIRRSNLYTSKFGQPLNIVALKPLETQAAGNKGRAVAYRNDPEVLGLNIVKSFTMYPPHKPSPIQYQVYADYRIAPLNIKLPKAIRYLDLIT